MQDTREKTNQRGLLIAITLFVLTVIFAFATINIAEQIEGEEESKYELINKTCQTYGTVRYENGTVCLECVVTQEIKYNKYGGRYKNENKNNTTPYIDNGINYSKCK